MGTSVPTARSPLCVRQIDNELRRRSRRRITTYEVGATNSTA